MEITSWHEKNHVWGLAGFFATLVLAGIGFGVTGVSGQVALAHCLFGVAFPCGFVALSAVIAHYVRGAKFRCFCFLGVALTLALGLWHVDAKYVKSPTPTLVVIQLSPAIPFDAPKTEYTGAYVTFRNNSKHVISGRNKLLRFPPIKSVSPETSYLYTPGKVEIVGGNIEGSTILRFEIQKLLPGQTNTFEVIFLKPEEILSFHEWISHYDYVDDNETWVLTTAVKAPQPVR